MRSLTTDAAPDDAPEWANGAACPAEEAHGPDQKPAGAERRSTGGAGFLLALMIAATAAGLHFGGVFDRAASRLARPADIYLQNLGVTLDKIIIRGQSHLDDGAVLNALGIRTGQSLFGFDPLAAQERLSRLGLVRSARVMRLLPSTLLVELEERTPYVRWLHDGRVDLVDADGVVLANMKPEGHSAYPLVSGKGADRQAPRIMRLLAMHKKLAEKLKMAELVAGRRWNLHAKGGAIVMLPRKELALALARIIRLPGWRKLLGSSNLIVDMRENGRVYIRQRGSTTVSSRLNWRRGKS